MERLPTYKGTVYSDGDLDRKFGRTFIEIYNHRAGTNEAVWVELIEDGHFYSRVKDNAKLTLPTKEVSVITTRPPPTVTTFEEGVLIYSMRQRRQWQEGWCRATVNLWNQELMAEIVDHRDHFTACLYPKHYNIREAFSLLTSKEEQIAVALNRKWWVCKLEESDNYGLYRNRLPVGVFLSPNPNSLYTHKPCTDFELEIQDLMRL